MFLHGLASAGLFHSSKEILKKNFIKYFDVTSLLHIFDLEMRGQLNKHRENKMTTTSFLIASENFIETFSINQLNDLPTGVYEIYENGRIKHHNHLVIANDEYYYLTSFDTCHDDELEEAFNENLNFGAIVLKSVSRHASTFKPYAEYSIDNIENEEEEN